MYVFFRPMINILRTPQVCPVPISPPLPALFSPQVLTLQVRAAQKGIPTGQVYQQNEERLSEIGTETLEVRYLATYLEK